MAFTTDQHEAGWLARSEKVNCSYEMLANTRLDSRNMPLIRLIETLAHQLSTS